MAVTVRNHDGYLEVESSTTSEVVEWLANEQIPFTKFTIFHDDTAGKTVAVVRTAARLTGGG